MGDEKAHVFATEQEARSATKAVLAEVDQAARRLKIDGYVLSTEVSYFAEGDEGWTNSFNSHKARIIDGTASGIVDRIHQFTVGLFDRAEKRPPHPDDVKEGA